MCVCGACRGFIKQVPQLIQSLQIHVHVADSMTSFLAVCYHGQHDTDLFLFAYIIHTYIYTLTSQRPKLGSQPASTATAHPLQPGVPAVLFGPGQSTGRQTDAGATVSAELPLPGHYPLTAGGHPAHHAAGGVGGGVSWSCGYCLATDQPEKRHAVPSLPFTFDAILPASCNPLQLHYSTFINTAPTTMLYPEVV